MIITCDDIMYCSKQPPEKVFSHSPRARELREAQARTEAAISKSSSSLHNNPAETKGTRRQQSIVTLSDNKSDHSSSSPVPAPGGRLDTLKSTEDRNIILSHTRSIAALAAKKRTKVTVDGLSMNDEALNKTYTSMTVERPRNTNRLAENTENYLSQSRLAIHDKKYGGAKNPVIQHLKDNHDHDQFSTATTERHSYFTEPVIPRPQNRTKYRPKPTSKKMKNQENNANFHQVSLFRCLFTLLLMFPYITVTYLV